MDRRWLYPLMVAAVASVALFTNLGTPRLWDRDEPRNARCAAEMWARGDWIVPTFNDELRAHKPVLLYWLMLVSYAALGETELAARLPSAMLGIGSALLTYLIGRRLFSPRAGLWAGVALATCLSFDVAGRAATPDAALIFTVTAALAAFVHFAFPAGEPSVFQLRAAPRTWHGWAATYALLGLAVLAKGPVGLLLPVGILGVFLLAANRPRDSQSRFALLAAFHPEQILAIGCRMKPLLLVAAAMAVAAPWYIAVHVQTDGAFTDEFFFKHNVERATSAMEGHRGPVIYYLAAMLVGFFPWSIFAVPVALETIRLLRRGLNTETTEVCTEDTAKEVFCETSVRNSVSSVFSKPAQLAGDPLGATFALCWAGVWIGAFSLVGTKLPNYIAPAYPALALLTGLYIDRWLAGTATAAARWTPWALASLAAVGVGLGVGLPLASRRFFPGDEILGLVGLVPLATAMAAWWFHRRGRVALAATSLAAGAIVLAVALFGFAQVRIDERQISEGLVATIRAETTEAPFIAAFRDLEPSFVFYARETVLTFGDERSAGDFFRRQTCAYMIVDAENVAALVPHLPPDIDVIARRAKFLKLGEVVVLGRTATTIAKLHREGSAVRMAEQLTGPTK